MSRPSRSLAEPPRISGPWVHSPLLAAELSQRCPAEEQRAEARTLRERGLFVVEDVFEPDLLAEVATVTTAVLEKAGEAARGGVRDAWRCAAALRRLACHPAVLERLRRLYGREPFAFETLSLGASEARSWRCEREVFDSYPMGFSCSVCVSLAPDGVVGTLAYLTSSHRWPAGDLAAEGCAVAAEVVDPESARQAAEAASAARLDRLAAYAGERIEISLRPGAAAICDGALVTVTGASLIAVQVTRYFFRQCLYWAPSLSHLPTGELFLHRPVDVMSGELAEISCDGLPVEGLDGPGLYRLVRSGGRNGAPSIQAVPAVAPPGDLRELRRRQQAAERHVRDLGRIIEMLEGSLSYRIGRVTTAPFRFLRDLFL